MPSIEIDFFNRVHYIDFTREVDRSEILGKGKSS